MFHPDLSAVYLLRGWWFQITYEEFSKMDIRIATVLEAEKVPKTTKLMKLLLDTGLDKRTVVSGIAEYFKVDPTIVRLLLVVGTLLFFGAGVIAYLIAWIIVPEKK